MHKNFMYFRITIF